MKCQIAFVTDLHFSSGDLSIAANTGQWGAVLLRRTVERLNRNIKPDVTVVLGDLVEDRDAADAPQLLATLRRILDDLQMPWLAIPGNHDPAKTFFNVFDRVDKLDIKGVRLVPIVDVDEPGRDACRNQAGFDHMAAMANGHDGPLVALQHRPICDAPEGYANCDQVRAAMREHGYNLAVSGHLHRGVPLKQEGGLHTMVAPGLCREPYNFSVVTIDGDNITAQTLCHQMPPS